MSDAVDQELRIDLFALVHELWRRKLLVILIMVLAIAAGVTYLAMSKSLYVAQIVVVPQDRSDIGARVPAGLGTLSGLTGFSLGGTTDMTQAVAAFYSKVILEEFIEANDLTSVLFAELWDAETETWAIDAPEDEPTLWTAVERFNSDVRSISENAAMGGVITMTIEWNDAETVAAWANGLVELLNEQLRQRDLTDSQNRLAYLEQTMGQTTLSEMRTAVAELIKQEIQIITMARADSEYAFKVIDPARVPTKRSWPRPILILVLAGALGGILSVGLVLLLGWQPITSRRGSVA